MKAEYAGNGGFPQRNSVEHKEYAEAYSTETQKVEERDGADLLEKVLDRDNLNRAYKRVKANKGACGVGGMTIDEALPWLKEHRDELLESIRNGKYKPSPVRRVEIPKDNGGKRQLGIDNYYDQMGTLVERSASTSGDTDLYDREIKKLCDKIEALRETLKTEQSKSIMTEDVKASIDRILGYLSKTDERSFLTYDDVTIRRLVECIAHSQAI